MNPNKDLRFFVADKKFLPSPKLLPCDYSVCSIRVNDDDNADYSDCKIINIVDSIDEIKRSQALALAQELDDTIQIIKVYLPYKKDIIETQFEMAECDMQNAIEILKQKLDLELAKFKTRLFETRKQTEMKLMQTVDIDGMEWQVKRFRNDLAEKHTVGIESFNKHKSHLLEFELKLRELKNMDFNVSFTTNRSFVLTNNLIGSVNYTDIPMCFNKPNTHEPSTSKLVDDFNNNFNTQHEIGSSSRCTYLSEEELRPINNQHDRNLIGKIENQKRRRKICLWSKDECIILVYCVRLYGRNWKSIISRHRAIFKNRSNIDLSNKYINLRGNKTLNYYNQLVNQYHHLIEEHIESKHYIGSIYEQIKNESKRRSNSRK